jgi:hypothetical protein
VLGSRLRLRLFFLLRGFELGEGKRVFLVGIRCGHYDSFFGPGMSIDEVTLYPCNQTTTDESERYIYIF